MSGTLVISSIHDQFGKDTFWDTSRTNIEVLYERIYSSLKAELPDLVGRFEVPVIHHHIDLSDLTVYQFNTFVNLVSKVQPDDNSRYSFAVLKTLLYLDKRYAGDFAPPTGKIVLSEKFTLKLSGWVFQLFLEYMYETLITLRHDNLMTKMIEDKANDKIGYDNILQRIKSAVNNHVLNFAKLTYAEEKYVVELYFHFKSKFVDNRRAGAISPKFDEEFYPNSHKFVSVFEQVFEQMNKKWLEWE